MSDLKVASPKLLRHNNKTVLVDGSFTIYCTEVAWQPCPLISAAANEEVVLSDMESLRI